MKKLLIFALCLVPLVTFAKGDEVKDARYVKAEKASKLGFREDVYASTPTYLYRIKKPKAAAWYYLVASPEQFKSNTVSFCFLLFEGKNRVMPAGAKLEVIFGDDSKLELQTDIEGICSGKFTGSKCPLSNDQLQMMIDKPVTKINIELKDGTLEREIDSKKFSMSLDKMRKQLIKTLSK